MTLDKALALLEEYGDEGKVLAGAQSLIPLMRFRFAAPRAVVDINRLSELDHLEEWEATMRSSRRTVRSSAGSGARARSRPSSARRSRRSPTERPGGRARRGRVRVRGHDRVLVEPQLPEPLHAGIGDSPATRTLAELPRTVGWRVFTELQADPARYLAAA